LPSSQVNALNTQQKKRKDYVSRLHQPRPYSLLALSLPVRLPRGLFCWTPSVTSSHSPSLHRRQRPWLHPAAAVNPPLLAIKYLQQLPPLLLRPHQRPAFHCHQTQEERLICLTRCNDQGSCWRLCCPLASVQLVDGPEEAEWPSNGQRTSARLGRNALGEMLLQLLMSSVHTQPSGSGTWLRACAPNIDASPAPLLSAGPAELTLQGSAVPSHTQPTSPSAGRETHGHPPDVWGRPTPDAAAAAPLTAHALKLALGHALVAPSWEVYRIRTRPPRCRRRLGGQGARRPSWVPFRSAAHTPTTSKFSTPLGSMCCCCVYAVH